MEFLRDPHIDFMKYRRFWIVVSTVLIGIGLASLFVHGELNMGIDFAGGTQLTLKFRERPAIDELRGLLAGAGLGDATIQPFGGENSNEVLIKTPIVPDRQEGSRERIVAAIERRFGVEAGAIDVNHQGTDALADLLLAADPERLRAQDEAAARQHYEAVAAAVARRRERVGGLFASWDEVANAEGLSAAALAALKERATLGVFSVVGAENVGPQIGAELRRKGILAVAFSLVGMLLYIWYRFELRFGIGALVASAHDVFVTLGLFTLLGYEFNLTTVAAFLTLVGYSVNDTVVIFDRVRENMRRAPREALIEVMNRSINQTLSRTILTAGTTLLATGALLAVGGDVLRGFAFIMTVGVIVGTYSSVYIASPFALLWEQVFAGRRGKARPASGAGVGPGRGGRAAAR